MTTGPDGTRLQEKLKVLVAVDVPRPEQISPLLIELYRPLKVCLLGTFVVPEQTAPTQAREQFGHDAEASLEEVADAFRETGVEVETRLVFTPDVYETVERTAVEEGCHAVLLAKPAYRMERILAALRPGPLATRVIHFLAELLCDSGYGATLLYVLQEKGDPEEGRRQLNLLRRELLSRECVDEERVEVRLKTDADREEAVASAVRDHDVVVIGETEPTVREAILGDFSRRLADETDTPVIVVRREL